MRINIIFYLLCFLFSSCATTQNSNVAEYYSKEPDLSKVIYEGGDGQSMRNAILIKHAKNERNGIAAEYAFAEKMYGKKNIDWKLIRQSSDNANNRKYDILNIHLLPNGKELSIYFDITEFYGKW